MGRKVEFTIYRGGIGWVVGPDLGGGPVRSSVLDLGSRDAPWAQLGTQESGAEDLGVSND